MLDKRNLKYNELNLEKYSNLEQKVKNYDQFERIKYKLTEREVQILRNKSHSEQAQRQKILLKLDSEFNYNRTKMAEYLRLYGMHGYGRSHIYKIIGKPVFKAKKFKIISEELSRVGGSDLLLLIVQKNAQKISSKSKLGSQEPSLFKK